MALALTPAPGRAVADLERNLWSMWRQFGRGEGCHLVDEPGILRFETPLARVPYNTVLRFHGDEGVDGVDVDERIDAVLAAYQARDVPVMWIVHPSARPLDLGARLAALGLVEAEVVTGMVAPLSGLCAPDPAPADVVVEELRPGAEDAYLDLVTWRYGVPAGGVAMLRSIMARGRFGEPGSPNRSWIARRGGTVVSKVTLHLDGETAGIYGVATRPEARGLGLARRLTLDALHAARAAGATAAVLHSTPMAVPLYAAIGFDRVADFSLYASPGTLHL